MLGAHLGRLGGVIARPRATFDRLLSGQGSLWEVFFWMVIVTAAIAPTRAGRAVLIGRGSLVDGALAFAGGSRGIASPRGPGAVVYAAPQPQWTQLAVLGAGRRRVCVEHRFVLRLGAEAAFLRPG